MTDPEIDLMLFELKITGAVDSTGELILGVSLEGEAPLITLLGAIEMAKDDVKRISAMEDDGGN